MLNLDYDILRRALFRIEENSYHNLCLLEETMTNPLAIYRYEMDNTVREKHVFRRDFNKKADYIVFNRDKEDYLKFSFPININCPEDREDLRKRIANKKKFVTLQERGRLNRPNVQVFANSLKVPDDEVYLTMFNGGIDIYVPKRHFNDDEKDTLNLMINKHNGIDRYLNFTANGGQSQYLFVNTDRMINLKKDNVWVYRNGYRIMDGVDFNLFVVDNKVYVDFDEEIPTNERIEVTYADYVIYSQDFEVKSDSLLDFPIGILEDLPISVELLDVYVDGRKLFPHEIKILTARHFQILGFEESAKKVSVRVIYNPAAITNLNKYIDDILRYFRYKDREEIKDILIDKDPDIEVPDYIENIDFPPPPLGGKEGKPIDDPRTYEQWLEDTINEYIRQNTEALKELLNFFAGIDDQYSIIDLERMARMDTSKDLGEYNKIIFDTPHIVLTVKSEVNPFEPLVFINNEKIYRNEVTRVDYMGRAYLYISADLVKDGDIARIKTVPILNQSQKGLYFSITEENRNDAYFTVPKSSFGKISRIRDIRMMLQKGEGFKYLKVGTDYAIVEDESNAEKLRIYLIGRNVGDMYYVYNDSFYDYRLETITAENPLDRITLIYDRYSNEKGFYIPKMSNYSRMVFMDRELMIEGLDYFISTPEAHEDIVVSKMKFKNIPKQNGKVEIYYVEQAKTQLGAIDKVDSQLGLIFFKDLPFPFSLNYLEVYVDGYKLKKGDIEIISDRIIRIINPDIPRPYINVVVYTNLDVPIEDLGSFTDTYEDDPSDYEEDIIEHYIPHEDENGNIVTPSEDLDDLYEEQHPGVEPLPIDPEQPPVIIPERKELLLSLIALKLREGTIPRRMNANENLPYINNVEFVEVMSKEELASDKVALNPNKANLLYEGLIDPTGTLPSPERIAEIFAEELRAGSMGNKVDFNDPLDNYEESRLAERLYKEELRLANSDLHVTQDSSFDANDFDESLEEKVIETLTTELTNPVKVLSVDDPSVVYYKYNVKSLIIDSVVTIKVNEKVYDVQPDDFEYVPEKSAVMFKAVKITKNDTVTMTYNRSEYIY